MVHLHESQLLYEQTFKPCLSREEFNNAHGYDDKRKKPKDGLNFAKVLPIKQFIELQEVSFRSALHNLLLEELLHITSIILAKIGIDVAQWAGWPI